MVKDTIFNLDVILMAILFLMTSLEHSHSFLDTDEVVWHHKLWGCLVELGLSWMHRDQNNKNLLNNPLYYFLWSVVNLYLPVSTLHLDLFV